MFCFDFLLVMNNGKSISQKNLHFIFTTLDSCGINLPALISLLSARATGRKDDDVGLHQRTHHQQHCPVPGLCLYI